jgi:hypothetical protein
MEGLATALPAETVEQEACSASALRELSNRCLAKAVCRLARYIPHRRTRHGKCLRQAGVQLLKSLTIQSTVRMRYKGVSDLDRAKVKVAQPLDEKIDELSRVRKRQRRLHRLVPVVFQARD